MGGRYEMEATYRETTGTHSINNHKQQPTPGMTSLLILVVDCWYYLALLRSYHWLPVHVLYVRCTYVIPNMAAYQSHRVTNVLLLIWWLMGHRSINSFITIFIPATLQLYWSTCIILASIGKKPCWAGSGCFVNKQSFSIFDR